MKDKRVVITGMGVVAPNGIGLPTFEESIRLGKSGIRFFQEMAEMNFGCQIGGEPELSDHLLSQYFTELALRRLHAKGIIYGIIAGMDAWTDAGLSKPKGDTIEPDWESGTIFGAGICGMKQIRDGVYLIDNGKVKRLGSSLVEQTMPSGISAHLGGYLGLGNRVSTNASACSTGTEAIVLGYERIKMGKAKRMLCGGCESPGPYVWCGFDAMRVLTRKFNDHPERGSRPLSATSSGFVPGSGAGALLLEDLESAQNRGATIYAEVIGGFSNSGGHREKGSMTAPNSTGVQHCIRGALADAHISGKDIDLISGHLTSTMGDPVEVENWAKALKRKGADFPYINSLKSMVGHCLSASGAIESVAAVLQMKEGFIHPSINCEDLHPKIVEQIDVACIPQKEIKQANLNIVAKSSFGFGDVNCCVIFKKYD